MNTTPLSPETPATGRPAHRLALFFDGTWNTPESATNVWRLDLMLAETSDDGVPQLGYYDPGVGTHWWDRLSGGAFGAGLSENVRAGYYWLMEHYHPGDEIYLFGFSRGAFTARSLAGLIARCGLLRPNAPMSYVQLYERYQKGDTVRPIYKLRYLQRHGETEFDFEEQLLLNYTYYQRNFIKMVGVWDTVGSLGVPLGNIPGFSRSALRFHSTHLSKIVQHSYQALALDEQRRPFWAMLWTQFVPAQPADSDDASQVDNRYVEQRWFAGAHGNVGGGYRNDLLPQRPLAWLQEKAAACGLAFRSFAILNDDDLKMPPRDSYAEFLHGFWKYLKIFPFARRYRRWVMAEPVKKEAHWKGNTHIEDGWVETVNERIDLSVFRRCQLYPDYRPPNLVEWAKRKGLELEKVICQPEQYPQLWTSVTQPGIESHVPLPVKPNLQSATKRGAAPVGRSVPDRRRMLEELRNSAASSTGGAAGQGAPLPLGLSDPEAEASSSQPSAPVEEKDPLRTPGLKGDPNTPSVLPLLLGRKGPGRGGPFSLRSKALTLNGGRERLTN